MAKSIVVLDRAVAIASVPCSICDIQSIVATIVQWDFSLDFDDGFEPFDCSGSNYTRELADLGGDGVFECSWNVNTQSICFNVCNDPLMRITSRITLMFPRFALRFGDSPEPSVTRNVLFIVDTLGDDPITQCPVVAPPTVISAPVEVYKCILGNPGQQVPAAYIEHAPLIYRIDSIIPF